jgi:cation:H+ antiporter
MRISKFLGWREFIVAFFAVAFGASLPDLLVGITAALNGIPELSFGDVISGNVIDLTLAIALTVLISGSSIEAESKLVQKSALFTAVIAILPLFLVLDGTLSRGDGAVLILAFIFYTVWVFSRSERFHKVYDGMRNLTLKDFFSDLGIIAASLALIILASYGIVKTAVFLGSSLNMPLILIGILIVALGNALPETYFAIVSARRAQNWMVLGDLMGSIISCATVVLGTVALIHPIKVANLPSVAIARLFLIIAAGFFLLFTLSGKRITKREAVFLFAVYLIFIAIEVMII